MRLLTSALVVAALVVLAVAARKASAAVAEPTNDSNTEKWTDNVTSWLDNLTQDASVNEARYRPAVDAAERANGIPTGLLGRLLYQESHYRTDIITGQVKSAAGAVGIAQFLPSTAAEVGIDPFDPVQSINGAGRYLRRLFDRFGDWSLALMAYNWGQGNVAAYLSTGRGAKGQTLPAETSNYVAQIAGDVGLA